MATGATDSLARKRDKAGTGRGKRLLGNLAIYALIIVVTLVVVDLILMGLGLFPPTYDYGHPKLGWVSSPPTGKMREDHCLDLITKQKVGYTRNEDGLRTEYSSAALRQADTLFKVAVSGDSHTQLCAPNERVHFGVMERELDAQGMQSAVFAYGAGMYSPLQAYLAVKDAIERYSADALVLNFYTGNDFYDMLRIDDRPHFVAEANHYRIAEPVWYWYDKPGQERHSRLLFVIHKLARETGIQGMFVRVKYLLDAAERENVGRREVVAYMNDLRKSASKKVEYNHAFSAQMLNQQLFFHHFPGSKEEGVRRVKALLEMIRRQHPQLLLVLSPVPSYELVHQEPGNEALLEVLAKLPISYDAGVAEEGALYETLRTQAVETGWLFVDNLRALRQYQGKEPLYNHVDYHIEPVASEIIGRAQAADILRNVKPARTVRVR